MKGENDLNKLTKANDLISDKCGKYERERQQNLKPLKLLKTVFNHNARLKGYCI